MLKRSVFVAVLFVAVAAIAPAQVLLAEDFNDNSAGWTLGTQWAIGPATASAGCVVGQDPGSDADGIAGGGVAGVVLGGCTGTAIHGFYYLESPVIDTTGSNNLRLEFDRWLNADYLNFMDSTVDVWNGGAWVNLFNTPCCSVTADAAWNHIVYNITAHSNPRLKVRFGYSINQGGVYNSGGWNVDNVRISNGEYFFDRFNNNAAGWTLGTQWGIGAAVGGGGCTVGNDPGSDGDGTAGGGLAGVVIGGCTGTALHPFYYIEGPVVDTSTSTALVLSLSRFLNCDYPNYMYSEIDVWNGAAWVNKFSSNGTYDAAWSTQTYNCQAESNAGFKVRIGYSINQAFSFSSASWSVDNVSIHDLGGSCTMQMSAYAGPGSVRISSHCLGAAVPPGTQFFQCFTLNGAGPGWFFGINPSLAFEVIPQYSSLALPFVGNSNAAGDLVWDLPGGVPAGITVYGVMVALSASSNPVGVTPAITFTTL